ncbi:hypothetical protein [Asticcacaulis sp. YBE204]|uniref:hypothetical protein n=1 Tax=Asticcacaulis sp. YBE204 TaxID=1282363 RepID=UPI0012DDBFA3|nr:hypothetical protein [Asticcacaulis sp. YBE204]
MNDLDQNIWFVMENEGDDLYLFLAEEDWTALRWDRVKYGDERMGCAAAFKSRALEILPRDRAHDFVSGSIYPDQVVLGRVGDPLPRK